MTDAIDPKRLVIPALAPLYDGFGRYSYAFMRFCTGAILVPHGWLKITSGNVPLGSIERLGLPAPQAWAWLAAGTEFFGAIMLALIPPMAVLLVVFMHGGALDQIVLPLVLQGLELGHRIPHSVFPALLVLAGGFALRWVMVGAGQLSHLLPASAG